jgi:uncharacterized protein (DUF4415 family)
MADSKPVVFDADNPEWTDADFARARPASELHDDAFVQLLVRPRGRPPLNDAARKQAINIRLDKDVIAYFRASGPGWQTRVNDVLARAVKAQTGGA